MKSKTHKAIFVSVVIISIFGLPKLLNLAAAQRLGQIVYSKDSLYQRIFVYQNGPVTTLRFGRQPPIQAQTRVNLNNLREHMLEYTMLTFSGLLYKPEPKKILVVGLGGGVIPREMRYYYPNVEIDAVEIDSEIPPIAEQFFSFREDEKLKVHISDGRTFIKKQLRNEPVPKYDLIILDAFNNDYIPFHLMTKEFLEEVKGVLSDDGAVVANVFYRNRLFDAEFKTYLAAFERCQVFLGTYSNNAILVAPGPKAPTLTPSGATNRAKMWQQKHKPAFNMIWVARRLRPKLRPGKYAKVLTDDRAPVNQLRNQTTRTLP
ncbi:MAG: fused MFS/spermidine synthase [Phycisphaerales bacterium]|jgi:spermidine synthase